MVEPKAAVSHLEAAGFTHVVWIPDSSLGPWESALVASQKLQLIRPCREGEAIGIAAGLILGGAKPVVVIQCTGLFEAGDALRNVVHDLKLPLKLIVGVRSYQAHLAGKSTDNCPAFTEPILRAWQLPFTILPDVDDAGFAAATWELADAPAAWALLLGE
ncbi:MAG TPA: thiamine pyrophosphate-binding protein [Gemmataceae bacterium]|jgi:sulfopyruvate decarboxylase TPP-binding subunit|nr:thiamine pyrophosphate-binding protein [Gemmataceae bacterium]